MPHDADVAGSRCEKTGNAADGGCFAGAIGAEKSEDLAWMRGEGDILDGGEVAVGFA